MTEPSPNGQRREVRAVAKWVRVSPRKARLVAQHIRGRSVPEARTVLAFTQKAAAREVEKVLRSAVANAEANHGLMGDDMVVAAAYVDDGVIMKRWRARARGRAARIRKRTCHITVSLRSAPEAPPRATSAAARSKAEEPVQQDEKPTRTPRRRKEAAKKPEASSRKN